MKTPHLRIVAADQAEPCWSMPDTLSHWAILFDIRRHTFARWLKQDIIRHKRLSRQRVMLDLNDCPAAVRLVELGTTCTTSAPLPTQSNGPRQRHDKLSA